MKRIDAKLGAKLVALVAERTKLRAEWKANRRKQIQLQIKLDRATTALAKAVGLEALLEFGREPHKSIS
jgi:hypothetical protein